jgi:hypothetical protein
MKEEKEKVISFGRFIPEWAKRLPKDLDFFDGYLFVKREAVIARLEMGSVEEERLYEDTRTLSCVKTILAGKQWDDPNAKENLERYTGKWSKCEDLYVPSKTVSGLISAIKTRDEANNRIYNILNEIVSQNMFAKYGVKK